VKKPIPFGKYYLLERINVGGMAEVFRAKAYGVEGFERLLAVKRILPNIAEDQEFITMFIDEAKIAVQLNHANVAQIFDLGVVDGSYFIAMEHIHGRDLRAIFERCKQKGEPMPIAQACFAAMKICEGLDYAHNKRDQSGREMHLVHRDVSPQNVIVSFEGEIKLIDFGIAKAAGKMGKTQAGILKGKFGYMSPEQVRGLPIDRRSDIFSTGIVLYELLTNERLFHGESDFSTLEKVRNVEILPPSTYNRKIPEELERIVLKALAKDVDDRYQNAIDLHDELQAFVYTAGEFYSRKDLAAWMKKFFTKEIEEETAKLEAFRQMAPPAEARQATPSRPVPVGAGTPNPQGVRRPTIATSPPPVPPRAPSKTTPPPAPGKKPAEAAVVAAAGKDAHGANGSARAQAQAKKAKPKQGPNGEDTGELEWDDEELETQIYDNPPAEGAEANAPPPAAPLLAPVTVAEAATAASTPAAIDDRERDREREKKRGSGPVRRGSASGGVAAVGGEQVSASSSGSLSLPPGGFPPPRTGSANGSFPHPSAPPTGFPASSIDSGSGFPAPPPAEEPSAVVNLAKLGQAGTPIAPPMSSFGSAVAAPGESLTMKKSSNRGPAYAAAFGVLALVLGVGGFIASSGGDKPAPVTGEAPGASPPTPQAALDPPPAPAPGSVGAADPNSGFKIFSVPARAQVKLDGRPVQGETPFQMTNITLGKHTIEVSAPGYQSMSREELVEQGKIAELHFKLLPEGMPGEVVARFSSEPPGAKVTLVVDGERTELGTAPVEGKLATGKSVEVVFEKDGYVQVTRTVDPIGELTASGGTGPLPVAAVLERAKVAEVTPPPVERPAARPPREAPVKAPPVVAEAPREVTPPPPREEKPTPAPSGGQGTLMLGAKPQCKIYIDGKDTGMVTPQRAIEVKAGTRKITLVNNEFGIRETFSVEVKAGATEKVIKDFSDKIPQ
jgi:serine/threonine protein kinase